MFYLLSYLRSLIVLVFFTVYDKYSFTWSTFVSFRNMDLMMLMIALQEDKIFDKYALFSGFLLFKSVVNLFNYYKSCLLQRFSFGD